MNSDVSLKKSQSLLMSPKKRKSIGIDFSGYWKYKYLTILFIPAVLYFSIFKYVPLYGMLIAFKDYNFSKGIWGSAWVGLQNFKELFSYGSFKEVLVNTVLISFYKLIWGFPSPIIFAILLNEIRNIYFKKTIQTISYLPHFLSWVVLGGLFIQFLSPSIGPINIFLKYLGLKPIFFLADPSWFRSVLVGTSIWQSIGWDSIIYLAVLAGINPEMYEAAIIDGATRLQRILYITIPSLAPIITIMLIFSVGNLINDDFNQIYSLYNPAVYSVGDVLSTYTYKVGLIDMRYGIATAVGIFRNVLSFILIILANAASKKINDYGIW